MLANESTVATWGMSLSGDASDTSVLALLTTLHCALTILRYYRPRGSMRAVLLPSLFFVVSPWLLPSLFWLTVVFVAHIAWFVACEKLLPAATPPRPAATSRQASLAPRPPPRPAGFQPLRVLAVIDETDEIRTFRLARPPGFNFKPGQFLMVKVEIDHQPLVRCYSISSSASTSGYLEISVRNQGRVSRYLHATVGPGTTLDVNGPGGAFVYPDGTRPIVLIAGGIGITPLLSMLRHAIEAEPSRPVTLLLSAHSETQLPFTDELRTLARRHPHVCVILALSGESKTTNGFFPGRIDAALIESVIPHPREPVYLLCGPLPMIEAMQRILASFGVPDAQIHFEKFEVATSLAASAAAPSAGRVSIQLHRSGAVVPAAGGQSMLEALEAAGESLPSMCRVGVCGTCRVKLTGGEAEGDFDALDHEDQAEGWILACVARPVTNCVIDA